jgi:ubiquinone/menaquinone biosynthesis C-methylase UbiE
LSDDRWSRTAARLAELEEHRREAFTEAVRAFVQPSGDEHALDLGTGTGALAFALAPYVADVLAVDNSAALLEEGRRRGEAFPNVTFVEADATKLDVRRGTFDLSGCSRVLHHVPRPEMIVASLARAIRFGGRVVVIDQIAPADPLVALELDRFERARNPEHQRLLPDADVRGLLEANGLVVERTRFSEETRDLAWYLDLADCQGDERKRANELAPPSPTANVGWYLAVKPRPGS